MSIATTPSTYLPFALPDIGEAEIAEVVDTLRSGWITTGPKARRFEREFKEFLGAADLHAIAVSSATAGLHLALEALKIGPGDEVIVPVHTFTATAEVVSYLGADPVFVDVDPATLTIDPDAVGAAITPRTRAILPVHYAGLACAMGPLVQIAAKHGLQIVEDAAHALPTTSCGGRLIGTLDTAATVFSFYATKTVATGEGGMIVTRSADIAERARLMRLHGINRDVFDRYSGKTDNGGWYYEVVAPGFKYNLPDLAAAIGLHQLARAQAMRQRRAAIAAAYDDAFSCLPVELPAMAPAGETHAWHLYVIRLCRGSRIQRDELIMALREAGIGTSVHYVPLHFHPYWRDRYSLRAGDFPASTDAYRRMISLPIYSKMEDADVERVIRSVRALLA
ncbi:DegT/DnrJ/EryC1/StrS family aminotransferase [Geminicoccus harenae]|uniref:DegT/DnrJ/EryC1/StrS family aminotransferase n=1 Tax=Geminicoccus harenae TaxID=2498453 RepID=UPI00168BC1F6|nr:DegT/DnrJ/EryC1/StrS family aminotransferase [Geminicoccus harenae]